MYFSEVVKLKDELLGKVVNPSPDDPSHTDGTYLSARTDSQTRLTRTHSILVTGRIDTVYPWDLEIPFVVGIGEWSDKST